jgi:hypothetical protein
MTLGPKIGEVSWVSMALRRVLLLAKVLLIFIEVPGFCIGPGGCRLQGLVVLILWAVSRRAGSRYNLNSKRPAGAIRHDASWELVPFRAPSPGRGWRSALVTGLITSTLESPRHNFLSRHGGQAGLHQWPIPSAFLHDPMWQPHR